MVVVNIPKMIVIKTSLTDIFLSQVYNSWQVTAELFIYPKQI